MANRTGPYEPGHYRAVVRWCDLSGRRGTTTVPVTLEDETDRADALARVLTIWRNGRAMKTAATVERVALSRA
jgi:hypothetical protein